MAELNEQQARAIRARNNPMGEPSGHYTGRCSRCHSRNLWDDNASYGCNTCGAFWVFG